MYYIPYKTLIELQYYHILQIIKVVPSNSKGKSKLCFPKFSAASVWIGLSIIWSTLWRNDWQLSWYSLCCLAVSRVFIPSNCFSFRNYIFNGAKILPALVYEITFCFISIVNSKTKNQELWTFSSLHDRDMLNFLWKRYINTTLLAPSSSTFYWWLCNEGSAFRLILLGVLRDPRIWNIIVTIITATTTSPPSSP